MPTGIYKRTIGVNCGLFKGKHHTKEANEKNRQSHLGKNLGHLPYNTLAGNKKISIALKGKHCSPRTEFKKGQLPTKGSWQKGYIPWNKGTHIQTNDALKKHVQEYGVWNKGKEGLQMAWNKGIFGKDSHAWLGGRSFEPYGPEFNRGLKEQIRERDNYTCQVSGLYGNVVHHIDYDKKNNHPSNLITLSNNWNSKVNSNRKYWMEYFQKKHGT